MWPYSNANGFQWNPGRIDFSVYPELIYLPTTVGKKIMLLCSIFLRSRQLYHSDVFSKQTGKTELPISMFTQTSSEIQLLLEEPKDTRHSLHEQTMSNCLDHQQEDPKIKNSLLSDLHKPVTQNSFGYHSWEKGVSILTSRSKIFTLTFWQKFPSISHYSCPPATTAEIDLLPWKECSETKLLLFHQKWRLSIPIFLVEISILFM